VHFALKENNYLGIKFDETQQKTLKSIYLAWSKTVLAYKSSLLIPYAAG